MKILYVAGREVTYSRTHNVLKALQKQNFSVIGCFPPDRSFKHYPKLIRRAIRHRRHCDVLLVGFYGQLLLPVLRIFFRQPILFDMYIATSDTMVFDRGVAKPGSPRAKIYRMSDKLSCRLSQKIILETHDHIADFAFKFGIPDDKFKRIFLTVDDELIYPKSQQKKTDKFLVHFHGEFAPFHGVKYILQAASLLRQANVAFQIVGKGITYAADRRLAAELELDNVRFHDPVPYTELADLMAQADLCLGIFGDNDRMLRVTTNKVVEALAMARPLITGRNEPVQELVTHRHSAYLVERANPPALAAAILELKNDAALRKRVAENGYRVFSQNCTLEVFGNELKEVIESLQR
jgi:glycosyltransferase involved in cell wall biosynthesis